MAGLGWSNKQERRIGVDKDHIVMSMYPDRSRNDEYFDKFMSALSELVDRVMPPLVRPGWAKQELLEGSGAECKIVA